MIGEGHNFKKKYGQNFLHDANIVNNIIREIAPSNHDRFLEIGPGAGAITDSLVHNCQHLSIVEIDDDLVNKLLVKYQEYQHVNVIKQDILTYDFSLLPSPVRIVGNLPYNISSPILFHCIEHIRYMIDGVFMLQKEFVDRICAKPNSKEYGRLSVMMQHFFTVKLLFLVSANCFYPKPKVDSSVIYLSPKPLGTYANDPLIFADIVKQAFAMRRKTLHNNLKELLSLADFNALELDPMMRAENLSVADFIKIANYKHQK